MDDVYKKYLLIEDTPPLFVPDDASDAEKHWWYIHGGHLALQQPGYLGIPNLTLEKYREFDSILVQNFGLHITDIANEQLQSLILHMLANPNYVNDPNNLPTILQSLGLSQDTPLEQTTYFIEFLLAIMAAIAAIKFGGMIAGAAGYTTIAQILNGTLHIADALDNIDDIVDLIQNSEYLWDIFTHGDTNNAIFQWLQELIRNLIKPNLNNQDINLPTTGNFPVPSAVGGQVYLTQLTNGIPGILYLYTFDPIQGIWILTGIVNSGTQEWWDIVLNPTPGTPPIYNGQGTKGWTPGIPTIGDPTGSNVLNNQPLPPFQTDPFNLWLVPFKPPIDNQIQPPPNVNLEHTLPVLSKPYLRLLESEEQQTPEIFVPPEYIVGPPQFAPDPRTFDVVPTGLLQPVDRSNPRIQNSNQWTWHGIDGNGNYYYTYNSGNYIYYLVYDPVTGEWKQHMKPYRIKDFTDEGNPDAQGSFPPPYGINIIDTFGEIIYVEYTNEYLKYNRQTGKYEPYDLAHDGVALYVSDGTFVTTLPDGRKITVVRHRYHPLLYDVAGNPRPRPWYAEQGLPWWNEPYWTHTTNPPDPLPNNWDTFYGWLDDFAKVFAATNTHYVQPRPFGGPY